MSRLEKIFILLETGTNSQTRKLAAQQIGEVVKSNPGDLFLVLQKIYPFLSHTNWQTRIAAGQAVEFVMKNVPQWRPKDVKDEPEELDEALRIDDTRQDNGPLSFLNEGLVGFDKFDLGLILSQGESLLSSDSLDFQVDPGAKAGDQSKQLCKSLGLGGSSVMGIDTSNLFTSQDLEDSERTQSELESTEKKIQKKNMAELINQDKSLSSRELNRLKRKSRLDAKLKEEPEETEAKRIKPDPENISFFSGDNWTDSVSWPYQQFLDQLLRDLFATSWERRHGSATAIRELVRLQGVCGGEVSGLSAEENLTSQQAWLTNIALRLVCVLALDRFGDFVSDQVVAPVRESTAQALGSVIKLLCTEAVRKLVQLLLTLVEEPSWECRHGGILGLKYVLAVRDDMSDTVLRLVYPTIERHLTDESDDVVAVAASALLPVVAILVAELGESMPRLSAMLWDSLLELDDLTSSTHSIMELLANLMSRSAALEIFLKSSGPQLKELVPRLFPFLSHSSIPVRLACLETLLILSKSKTGAHWLPHCILDALRHVYQRALLEHNSACLAVVPQLWNSLCENTPLQPLLMAGCPWFGPWIHLISGPSYAPLDSGALIHYSQGSVYYLGGKEVLPIVDVVEKEKYIARARNLGAKLLGKLASYIIKPLPGIEYTAEMETPLQMLLAKVLIPQLGTSSAYQKLSISIIIIQWLQQAKLPNLKTILDLSQELLRNLTCNQNFTELSSQRSKLCADSSDFTATLSHYNIPFEECEDVVETVETVVQPLNRDILEGLKLKPRAAESALDRRQYLDASKLKPKAIDTILDRRAGVLSSLSSYQAAQHGLELLTNSVLAGALSYLGAEALPDKLNPVLKPLMESVKREQNEEFQKISVKGLVRVLESCLTRDTSPLDKVVSNLCTFVCSHPEETPQLDLAQFGDSVHPSLGILTNFFQERRAENALKSKVGSKKKSGVGAVSSSRVLLQYTVNINNDDDIYKLGVQCRGARLAVQELVAHFGAQVFHKIPKLEEHSMRGIVSAETEPEDLVNSLKVLETMVPVIPIELHCKLVASLPSVLRSVVNTHTAVRFAGVHCLCALAKVLRSQTLSSVLLDLVPHLDSTEVTVRQGVVEALYCLSDSLTVDIVPYIVLLVVPVLGRMSDHNEEVRLLATNTFATLVKLMPLDAGVPDPQDMPPSLLAKKEKEKAFLGQLLDSKSAAKYELVVQVNAELRTYQEAGINWLGFLDRYKLHGVLCDDMGLGKTLQTICLLANQHSTQGEGVRSLVVCPATLGGHWVEEIRKFVDNLSPFLYMGTLTARVGLRPEMLRHSVVITSYDIVRNDIEFLGGLSWNYLVLDEGHVIKNTKSKTSQAIRKLTAQHRLILSGTPIQNSVVELWSLFDFLMPGYLGSEKQFMHRYARPILASRDGKCSLKEQEAGVLAMEALHRQTLPFILRRVKEDVLKDLPPKITQDYYCDLSPLQTQLYEDFAAKQSRDGEEAAAQSTHIFQALQYLKKVCNHPKLVLTKEHPLFDAAVRSHLAGNVGNLLDISHSAKLTALHQLLTDLGLSGEQSESVVSPHRALIFCQLKTMLDIVEKDLLKVHFGGLSYMRLDGSVPAQLRHGLVTRFNTDPSIDLLLLTTSVGGLGLNLTGADTVIFVEHDWNPMKDLQAMDRAHRIGQKRVVNVYRLITRNTLEEKIMSLQKFKIHTARTVISADNSSMSSMGTEEVLDLFSLSKDNTKAEISRSLLDSLPELWEEEQYSEEYDIDSYIKNLKS